MKLTLKVVVVLAVIIAAASTVYAEIPDVSKWSCQEAIIKNATDYGMEIMNCKKGVDWNAYIKVSGELIYIHEHRMDADKAVYYNALKTGDLWVEVINKKDFVLKERLTKNRDLEVSIIDDNGVEIAKRIFPLLKK